MKYSILLNVALLGSLAAANPLALSKPANHVSSTPTLREREDPPAAGCNPVNQAVAQATSMPSRYRGFVTTTALMAGPADIVASEFCKAFGTWEESRCSSLGKGVAGVLTLAAFGVIMARNLAGTGTLPSDYQLERRHDILVSRMESLLRDRGVEFESITATPLVARDTTTTNTTSLQILGMRSGSDFVSDHHLFLRDDGTGVSRATLPSSLAGRDLEARWNGPAFKMSYNFIKHDDPPEQADEGGIEALAFNFGQDWETRVNDNPQISRYFGEAFFGDSYTMAFQIMNEVGSFDDSYEDPNTCGVIS